MIKSIYLQNWKTHRESTFEFAKGTNVIVGKMGSGKSSVMDAISFALYNTFPSLASRKVSLEETITARPLKQEKSVVRLEFDYNGKNYSVERIVKRKGINEACLRENGKIISGPKTSDVTKKITEILEVSYDLFSRAIYAEQNEMDYFLRLSPSERKEKFDELLGIDKYGKARQNAVTLANRVKKTIEDRKSFLAEQKKKNAPQQLSEYQKRAEEKAKWIAEKKAEDEQLKHGIAEKGKKVTILREQGKEHMAISENLLKAKSKSETLTEQINRAWEKIKGSDIGKIVEKVKEHKALIHKKGGEIAELEKEISKTGKEEVSLKQGIAVKESMLAMNMKNSSETDSLGAACPVCRKPLSGHDREKLAEELGAEEKKLKSEISTEGKKLSELLAHIEKKEKLLAAAQKETKEIENGLRGLERLSEMASELAEKEAQKKLLEKEMEKLLHALSAIKFDEKELEAEEKEFYSLKEKEAKCLSEISSGKEMLSEIEAGVQRIKQIQEQIASLEKQVSESEKAVEKLAIFGSALESTQAELRQVMIGTINEAMDEIWQKIYPYRDFSSVKIMVEEGSYEIMVRQADGEWSRVEGILSGGERSAAALTMRIAVSLVLTQNLGWIILDEPTHNLDANAVKELGETMAGHLPQLIGQIFIITHDKEMENAASGKLYTLEREKEKDGETKIS